MQLQASLVYNPFNTGYPMTKCNQTCAYKMPDWLYLACLNCTPKAACFTQGMQCMCVGHCFRNLLCLNWEMCVAQIEFEVEVCRRWEVGGGGQIGEICQPAPCGQPPVNSLRVNKQLCPVDMSTWMMADRLLREFPTRLLNITWAWCLRLSSKENKFLMNSLSLEKSQWWPPKISKQKEDYQSPSFDLSQKEICVETPLNKY